jgi:hypothetical protein
MAQARKRKGASADRPGQAEPTAPLDGGELLAAARPVLELLREDLGKRAEDARVDRALRRRYEEEKTARRTADSFAEWRGGLLAQVAASWFLSCVFVRTLEDRGLLSQARLAGPGATDSQTLFFQLAPSLTERDYLLFVFRELAELPAARALFDREHAMVWQLSPSADAAKELLRLFRTPSAEAPAFRFGQASTRFLGDLYQDLYEDVRKRYALLQTPDFIESFILDRTLEPAIERFGLDDTTLIDPTCGSGHFLLGAFDRLFEHRLRAKPGIDVGQAAHQALDAVYGADINPYAVAIARVRLTLSYLEKAGIRRLKDAPVLPLHLVVADSLLYNPQHVQLGFEHQEGQSTEGWRVEAFQLEDPVAARDVLHRQYAAVIGNPPYITEKDSAKRETYRAMYPSSASGKYSLAAPFCERFFQLARNGGSVGQITSNSFMKREFGKTLIESYLPNVNLEAIINTSGAFIPGHSTPTVLLFGTHELPLKGEVLTVLAKRGEPSTPVDPANGEVWSSIAAHWSELGFDNDYITVASSNRDKLAAHPWSLGGGGAVELKELLEERAENRLDELVDSIGISCVTGEDEVFLLARRVAYRQGVTRTRPLVTGECIRDWALDVAGDVVFPYNDELARLPAPELTAELQWLWPYRSIINKRRRFGVPMVEKGLTWYELQELYSDKLRSRFSITFAAVATHNHFVLDRGGRVFKQTAPIVKLPATASEDDHLALLAYLNSSTACFWMKQVSYPKATSTKDIDIKKGKPEANRYDFAGTAMLPLPIPPRTESQHHDLVDLAREALGLAAQRERLSAFELVRAIAASADAQQTQRAMERDKAVIEDRLVAVQEDIDWLVYELFSLSSGFTPTVGGHDEATRPFMVAAQADVADVTVPADWASRLDQLRKSQNLRILEDPVFKRLWSGRRGVFGHSARTFDEALRSEALAWLQEQAETLLRESSVPWSRQDLSSALATRTDAQRVAALASLGDPTEAVGIALDSGDVVPHLAAQRFTATGLAKWHEWLQVWQAQRLEDAGGPPPSTIPPKYADKDFQDQRYWRLRGKLDVPKERFISYPGCESDHDSEPVYGWAGWNHLQRAQALASLYQKRKTEEGWTAERLTPMLAGLLELLPWIKQWHNEPDAKFDGQRMGDFFAQFLDGECQAQGLTHADLEAWRATKKTAARKNAAVATNQSGLDDEPVKPKRARKKKAAVTEASGDAASTAPAPEELG